jgi:hypothetical protein
MRNNAIKVEVTAGQNPKEVQEVATRIYKSLLAQGCRFYIDELALIGQLLAGCGCKEAWPSAKS